MQINIDKFFFKKNKAGVLSLVLGIGIIVAAVCTSMIYLAYFYRLSQIHDTNKLALNRRIDSGLNYILANFNKLERDKTYEVDLFKDGKDSVSFFLKPWGLFSVAKIYASQGKLSSNKTAVVGSFPGQIENSALYLADKSRPLSVGGNTYIAGNVFLPKSGVKKVVMNKVPYNGGKLIYGATSYSKTNLPMLNSPVMDNLFKSLTITGEPVELNPRDQLTYDFSGRLTRHFQAWQEEVVSGKFKGNMIIHSDEKIVVAKGALLEDIIIKAPFVHIEDGFQGNLQIVAEDTIIIGSNVKLKYPSALVILKNKGKALIQLQRRSQVEGVIIIGGKTRELHHRYLHFETESKLIGVAYAGGMVIMKGAILGHLSCSKFLYTNGSSLYENHIVDARIERNLLPTAFVGVDLWGDSHARGIVKWLD